MYILIGNKYGAFIGFCYCCGIEGRGGRVCRWVGWVRARGFERKILRCAQDVMPRGKGGTVKTVPYVRWAREVACGSLNDACGDGED